MLSASPKILIIRLSSIGDIVLTTPVMRCLKQDLTGVKVHYLTKPAFKSVLDSNPFIDKIWYWEGNKTLKKLKLEEFDCVIDLHNNIRTRKIKWYFRINHVLKKWVSFNKINILKMLAVLTKSPRVLPKKHIVDRYMETVLSLGVKYDNKGLDFFISAENRIDIQDYFSNLNPFNYYVYAIGGQHNTKKLPFHKKKELLKKLKMPVILLGGPDDINEGNLIASAIPNCYNACGDFNLQQTASIIEQSRKVFTHDTGLMHIAAALLKPIVVIWGNTIPEFGMYPYYPKGFHDYENQSLEVKVYCRPCSKIGFKQCPWGHFKCMENQNFTLIK